MTLRSRLSVTWIAFPPFFLLSLPRCRSFIVFFHFSYRSCYRRCRCRKFKTLIEILLLYLRTCEVNKNRQIIGDSIWFIALAKTITVGIDNFATIVLVVVVVWKGIHSRSDRNRTGAEGLSFRLVYCLNQMLAVMLLSQHRVLSSKTVRSRAPYGARCMEHAIRTWSAVWSAKPHSQFSEGTRTHLCMDEWNRPTPVLKH